MIHQVQTSCTCMQLSLQVPGAGESAHDIVTLGDGTVYQPGKHARLQVWHHSLLTAYCCMRFSALSFRSGYCSHVSPMA